jgi:predicted DNA-binding transcriptional regulator AlpA
MPHRATRVEATPRGALRRELAAVYCGVSLRHFDELVRAGELPKPRRLGASVKLWLTSDLDAALEGLPSDGESDLAANEWDAA